MALEMRVYEELNEIDPKIMAGLTFRQFGAVLLLGLLLAILAPLLWWLGLKEWISWVVIVPAVPLVAWGWIKPMGLRFEVWARHVITYWGRSRRREYRNWAAWSPLHRPTYEGKRIHVLAKERGKRGRVVVEESSR